MPTTATTMIEQRDRPTPPEQRTVDVDVRDLEARGGTVHGYAAVYGATSEDLGGFRERIAPGAFADVLSGDADVRCLLNHDPNIVLGRTRSGTLRLSDEERGLRFECDLPESRSDLREAIARGDLDGASFRFRVGDEEWDGEELRTVRRIAELFDISLATVPAYPETSIELRTRPRQHNEPRPRPSSGGGLLVRDRGLRVGDRASAPRRGLAEEFRAAGFPGEVAEIPWQAYEERAVTWSPSINLLDQVDRQGVGLPFDQRYAWTVLGRVGVDAGVTSVQVLQQSGRGLASAANVIRGIAATTDKAETNTTVTLATVPLSGVASVESGIPNVVLEQDGINTIIENDLRLAVNEGLDKLVNDTFAASGFQAPGTDNALVSYRKAMTTLYAAGYSPDTLILTPAAAEAIDVMVSGISGGTADFVFTPGAFGPDRIFTLRKVISKVVAAPVVLDSTAYAKLYASPARLARFEENDGKTNTSLVRLELHAACGVERQSAAVRIAAS